MEWLVAGSRAYLLFRVNKGAAATMNPISALFLISYSVFRGGSDDAVGHEYGKVLAFQDIKGLSSSQER